MLALNVHQQRRFFIILAVACLAGAAAWPARHAIRHSAAAILRTLRDHARARAGPTLPISSSAPAPVATRTAVATGKGATYYVSPTGDDSAPGSEKSPFKTLQHAADITHAGDTVIIRKGTYLQGMNLISRPAGSKDNPIAFLADDGVLLTHCAAKGANASLAAINIEATTGWIILQGFHIQSDGSMQRAGIRISGSDHVQVLDDTIDRAFIGIFASNSSDLRLENNLCENSTDQHGIYISAGCKNYVVRANTLFANHWDGLHTNASTASPNDGGLIENNVIYANHLSGVDVEGTTHSTFRNNLVYSNEKNGIVLHNQDQADTPPCSGNLLVNNTIISNGMFAVELAPGNAANTLFNNILLSAGRTYGSIGISGSSAGLQSDYNAVNDNFSTDLGSSAFALAAWRTHTGQDAHSLVIGSQSPFADAAQHDFRPAVQSPLIGAGAAQWNGHQAPTMDLRGQPRPADKPPDIGAFEHSSAAKAAAS